MAVEPIQPELTEEPSEASTAPFAWQPFTPRGIGAFAYANYPRVFVVQLIVGLLSAAVALWFLSTAWFPPARAAIRNLPAQGSIVHGELNWPRQSFDVLHESRPHIAFIVDLENRTGGNPGADLTLRFRKHQVDITSHFGYVPVPYKPEFQVEFNRGEVQAWWGAWEPIMLGWTAVLTPIALFVTWSFLATVYFVPAWFLGFYANRRLNLGGSWRLCSVALMPGAFISLAAIVLYGLGVLDLFHLALAAALHIVVGWACVIAGVLRLPEIPPDIPKANPFTPPEVLAAEEQRQTNPNPFGG